MSVYLRELTARLVDFPDVNVDILTRAQDAVCVEAKDISPQIRVVQIKGGPAYPIDRKYLYEFIPEFSENMEEYIHRKKENYDIIHSHYWLSGLAGTYIKNKLGLPHVHTYHTLGFMKKRAQGQTEHKSRANSERQIAHSSDSIISPSTDEKESLVEEYGILPSKVEVVYPGVNPRLFYPINNRTILNKRGYSQDNFVLLYVGRIEKVKGLINVIEALHILQEKNLPLFEKTKLIVIGGGKKEEELAENMEVTRIKREMKIHDLKDKVVFLGSIDQSHLRKYYSAADALVVPSLYESFGLVTVEALACGTPVVVSQVGKMKSIVKEGKNGFSFRPDDPVSLYQNLENLFKHRSQLWSRPSIREDVVQRFSWDNTAENTYQIFEGLINGGLWPKTIFQSDGSPQPV
ncbi:MAG: glycosyltransferase [Candidatus Aminicenantes bacterium]|nr:MAG: glycosyltransferase [Candidatus Aminicenantes bacterium]